MTEDVGLARAQLAAVPWSTLRANGSPGEQVRDLLTTMLFSDDDAAASEAYRRIENMVTAQGDLSPAAPGAVAVIVAAVAERDAGDRNMGPALDLLGLTLAGYTARWELDIGTRGIRAACYREAMRGYWSLRRIAASTHDPYEYRELAAELVEMLDDEAANPQPDPPVRETS